MIRTGIVLPLRLIGPLSKRIWGSCPYPRQLNADLNRIRKTRAIPEMPEFGTKRQFARCKAMSGMGVKADLPVERPDFSV